MNSESKNITIKLIEASLFSSGRPLSVQELSEALGLNTQTIENYIKKLKTAYSKRDGALEIIKVGKKYSMQVRPNLTEHVRSLAQMEIPQKVLKTAALIAYHQPIKQSELQEMFGAKVYDHVKVLTDMGLVRKRQEGRTVLLTTTQQFTEYFGIGSNNKDKMKEWLKNRVIENVKDSEKENGKGSMKKSTKGSNTGYFEIEQKGIKDVSEVEEVDEKDILEDNEESNAAKDKIKKSIFND
jgi:segregation and condensation protein B